MIVFTVESARVYRAGGRRFFSRSAAIKRYARDRFFLKYPCECEQEDYASGYPGVYCGHHDHWQKVMPRYLRRIRKALRSSQALGAVPDADSAVDPVAETGQKGDMRDEGI